jgi:hypothetical protein
MISKLMVLSSHNEIAILGQQETVDERMPVNRRDRELRQCQRAAELRDKADRRNTRFLR